VDAVVAAIAAAQLGLITRTQLAEVGLSARAISYRVASGQLIRVHAGVYRLAGVPVTCEQSFLAAQFAVGGEAAISHNAAGQFWGLDEVRADQPHLLVPYQCGARVRGVVVHRSRIILDGDIVTRRILRVTSPYRTIIDLAGSLSLDELEDVIEDGLRKRKVTVSGLLGRLDMRGRRGVPGAANLTKLLEEMKGEKRPSGSSLESRFCRRLRNAGLPKPVKQFDVYDASGKWIARPDFAFPAQRIAIEIEGFSWHSGRKRRTSDARRQNRLTAAGWDVLRYTQEQVDHDPAICAEIEQMLLARS
jgi:very-short-patch-repair endonuclease